MVNKQINIGWLLVGVLFSGNTNNGDHAGFGYANTNNTPSNTNANIGSHLCLKKGLKTLTKYKEQRPYLLVKNISNQKGIGRNASCMGYRRFRLRKAKI